MTAFTELAPAKINLTLEVLGKRADGYHEIASFVVFAEDAADEITLDTAKPSGSSISGRFAATIVGRNLIDVTLSKLAAAAPNLQSGHVHLIKNLPIAAGIGGGSADAAAVLRAVRRANPDLARLVDWRAFAQTLGADVPVCFESSASWMTGIGDQISLVDDVPRLAAVVVNPLQSMPPDKTAQVFRSLNAPPLRHLYSPPPPPGPFESAPVLLEYMMSTGNSLEAAACQIAPAITDVKAALIKTAGCQYAAVSGGGPTCFGIFADNQKAASDLRKTHSNWWIRAVTLG